MKKDDNNVVVWVGANNPELRQATVDLIGNTIADTIRNSTAETTPFKGGIDIKVIDSPLRAGSLLDVMNEYRPEFFGEFGRRSDREAAVHLKAVKTFRQGVASLSEAVEKMALSELTLRTNEGYNEKLKSKLDAARYIANSDRPADKKLLELQFLLDPKIMVAGANPEVVQLMIEKNLWPEVKPTSGKKVTT